MNRVAIAVRENGSIGISAESAARARIVGPPSATTAHHTADGERVA